jgi:uncharacterized membrane protein
MKVMSALTACEHSHDACPLLSVSPVIQIHAFVLGAGAVRRPQGHLAAPHRRLDLDRADDDRQRQRVLHPRDQAVGSWSPIHLLAIFTLAMLPLAVLHARRHRVPNHRWAMISIFTGGRMIAGAATFLPRRIMHAVAAAG